MTTFTVSTTADVVDGNYSQGQLSLREAVNQANATAAADTIVFAPAIEGQTLTLTGGELVLQQNVTIDGDQNNDGVEVTLSGGDAQRILRTSGTGTDVALHDLTLEHGAPSAGRGGAIFVGGGGLSLDGSTIQNNVSSYVGNYDHNGKGGGIFAEAGSKITISNSIVKGNEAGDEGGGIYAGYGSTLKLSNSLFVGNGAYNEGGGIAANDSIIDINSSEFRDNNGGYVGGAINAGGSLHISGSIFDGNTAPGDEGGGGAIAFGGSMTLEYSSIFGSYAFDDGALSVGGDILIRASTIANNHVVYDVSSIIHGGGNIKIISSTITGNEGGSAIAAAELTISNSIVSGNTAAPGYAPDVSGAITFSNGHNIFGSDVVGNVAGDRENIAPAALFAGIDPSTGGGLLSASGIVPLLNSIANPALSGGDPVASSATGQLGGAARPLPGGSLPDIGSIEISHALSTKPSANNDVITDSSAGHTVNALGGADYIKGMGGNDTLHGNDGSDLLDGGTGNDKLFGDAGIDLVFYGGSTKVTVDLSLATDKATRGTETDTLTSIEGAIGSSAGDTFKGDAAINWFQGGLGKDTFSGGSSRDLYDFNAVADSKVGGTTRDVITDFDHLVDKIDLMGLDADTTVAGNQAFHWIGTAALTGPGEVGYFTSAGNTIIHASNDGDAAGEFEVQLTGIKTLTAVDFYL